MPLVPRPGDSGDSLRARLAGGEQEPLRLARRRRGRSGLLEGGGVYPRGGVRRFREAGGGEFHACGLLCGDGGRAAGDEL